MDTERVIAAYLAGQSASSLAREHQVSAWKILNGLRAAGVEIRTSAQQNERRLGVVSERLLSLVDGLQLGDGSIDSKGALRLEQRTATADWLIQVQTLLREEGCDSRIIPIPPRERKIADRVVTSSGGKLLYTPCYVEMKEQRSRWYPEGSKLIPDDVRLDPLALAHWFAGDGSLNSSGGLCFYTNGFIKEEVERLCERLGLDHGIEAKTYPLARREGEYMVAVYKRDHAVKLRDLILPHLHPVFQYKLRHVRETLPPQRVFTEDEVHTIRSRFQAGEHQTRIAKDFGVHHGTISRICRRDTYKGV
jgi:hypothetical protein